MKLVSLEEAGKKDKEQALAELYGKYEQAKSLEETGRLPYAKEALYEGFMKIMEKHFGGGKKRRRR